MVRKPCGHRGRGVNPASCLRQSHVRPAPVVVRGVKGHRVPVVLDLLRERIGEPRETTNGHPHREVGPLDVTGRDVIAVRPAHDRLFDRSGTEGRAITALSFNRWRLVNLVEHGIVNAAPPKHFFDSYQIGTEPVGRKLDAVRKPRLKIAEKDSGVFAAALSDMKGGHELGVSVERGPRPDITEPDHTTTFGREIPLLAVAKGPNLVYLNPFARQVANALVVEGRASCSDFHQKLKNRSLRRAGNSHCGADGISIHQSGKDAHPLFYAKSIHADNMLRRASIVKRCILPL